MTTPPPDLVCRNCENAIYDSGHGYFRHTGTRLKSCAVAEPDDEPLIPTGPAVTVDEFIAALADGSGVPLEPVLAEMGQNRAPRWDDAISLAQRIADGPRPIPDADAQALMISVLTLLRDGMHQPRTVDEALDKALPRYREALDRLGREDLNVGADDGVDDVVDGAGIEEDRASDQPGADSH